MTLLDLRARPNPLSIDVPEIVRDLWSRRLVDIVKIPHPALRREAESVGRPTPEIRRIVDRMRDAMKADRGMGLAAPQLNINLRILVYRLPEDNAPFRVMIDPHLISAKGEQVGSEGCLSIPYLIADVRRPKEIIVKATDILGRTVRRRASELEARVILHEMDHLDGILFVDRAEASTFHWELPESSGLTSASSVVR